MRITAMLQFIYFAKQKQLSFIIVFLKLQWLFIIGYQCSLLQLRCGVILIINIRMSVICTLRRFVILNVAGANIFFQEEF